MNEYLKYALTGFIFILIFCCFKKQRRYWREMTLSRPTGSLKAGYAVAITTVFVSLPLACYANTREGWEIFVSVLLLTVVFCAKITFSPTVVGVILGICLYQLHAHDRFPFCEVWSAIATVFAWKLPEQVRAFYNVVTFVWALVILLGGTSTPVEEASAEDLIDVAGIMPE
jgi:hypothetical protein